MASSTENVKIGVCRVYYGGVDLGYTKGGVSVSANTDTYEVKVDQFGESPISENITARSVTVTVPMAETTIDNLVSIMPGATKKGTTDVYVEVETAIGTNLLTLSKELRLRPLAMADDTDVTAGVLTAGDNSEDFVVHKAGTGGALEFAYNHDSERVFNVTFKGYPNEYGVLFSYGAVALATYA
jgi:hypothetical protein